MRSPVDDEYSEHFTADDDRAAILGHELLWFIHHCPDDTMSRDILLWLDECLTDTHERALFNLPPPRPSGNVLPFRKPS